MKAIAKRAHRVLELLGVNPLRTLETIVNIPRFLSEARTYGRATSSDARFPIRVSQLRPILTDYVSQAGSASGHYFHQDLWAARKINAARPLRHVDVGSRIDGFVAHLLTFMPVEVIDVRPLRSSVPGLTFIQEDARRLASFAEGSLSSVSSLHAVEHFGLGRYGDPIDPDGWLRGIEALDRVLAPGGKLYFSVPVGRERVEFNAHRIFWPGTILTAFGGLRLASFSMVDDAGDLRTDCDPNDADGASYACGLFEFTK
jgi:SAM-dependent methyltransferase